MANFNDYPYPYHDPSMGVPTQAPIPQPEEIVTKLLQNGLVESVEQIVRKQFQQFVAGQMSEGQTRDHQGSRTVIGTEKLEPFDPDSPDSNVDQWIIRFDALGERYGWSDFEKMYLLKSKLVGKARDWYTQVDLNCPDYRWEDWKKELWNTFMRQEDFATNLEELVYRRKNPEETLSQYFHDKMILCGRCGIDGEKAVSVIIKGLPEDLRPKAYSLHCRNPEVLFNEFIEGAYRSFEEEVFGKTGRFSPPVELQKPPKERKLEKKSSYDKKRQRCYACGNEGHVRAKCPNRNCSLCGRKGHRRVDCVLDKQPW